MSSLPQGLFELFQAFRSVLLHSSFIEEYDELKQYPIVMRNCGHVMCNPCVDMFVKKAKRCYVCEQKVKSKDIVDMSPEGTGFAGNSTSAVATKWDVAFQ